MKRLVLATLLLGLPGYASAQIVEPPAGPSVVVPVDPDATGTVTGPANSGPGAVIVAPGRTGASTADSDPAAGTNAEQPSRLVPQYGRNGGNGAGGGQ